MKTLAVVLIAIAVLLQLCAPSHGGGTEGRVCASIGRYPDGHERAWRLVLLVRSPDVSLSNSAPLSDVRASSSSVLSSAMCASATEIRQNPVTIRLHDHGTRALVDNH